MSENMALAYDAAKALLKRKGFDLLGRVEGESGGCILVADDGGDLVFADVLARFGLASGEVFPKPVNLTKWLSRMEHAASDYLLENDGVQDCRFRLDLMSIRVSGDKLLARYATEYRGESDE